MPPAELPSTMAISPPRLDDTDRDPELILAAWADWLQGLTERDSLMVQVRAKRLSAAVLFKVVELTRACLPSALLTINRRVDVALAARADGVQLPEDGLPVDRVRSVTGPELLIGRSVHGVEGCRQAAESGADWVTLSPIFDPLSKAAVTRPLGPEILREASGYGIPVYALGGITEQNRGTCLQHGAYGVAGVGTFDRPLS